MKKIILLFLLAATACSSEEKPQYIDTGLWQSDAHGCNGNRIEVTAAHPEIATDLIGKSEETILEWLGKPDKNELYKRNQKFFIYSLEPDEQCTNSAQNGKYLQIRFSATNRAQEVMIYN